MVPSREENARREPWRRLLLVGLGYLATALLGSMLIAPMGPGSDRIAYLCLLVYSLLVAVFCARLVRVVALLLAALFLIGVVVETKAQRDFQRHLKESREGAFVDRGKP